MTGVSPVGAFGSIALPSLDPTSFSYGVKSTIGNSDFLALPKSTAGFASGTLGVRNGFLSVFSSAEVLAGVVASSTPKPPPIPSPFDIKLPPAKADTTPDGTGSASSNASDIAQQNQQTGKAIAVSASLQQLKTKIAFARGSGNDAAVDALTPLAVTTFGQLQNSPFAGLGSTPPKPFASPEVPKLFLNLGV